MRIMNPRLLALALLPALGPSAPAHSPQEIPCTYVLRARTLQADCPSGETFTCPGPIPEHGPQKIGICCNHRHLTETYQEATIVPLNTNMRYKMTSTLFRRYSGESCELDSSGATTGSCTNISGPVQCTHSYTTDTLESCG